jgi:hypothetical protein
MTNFESQSPELNQNQDCVLRCPIIQEDNLSKQNLLSRLSKLSKRVNDPEERDNYVAAEIQRIYDSDPYRKSYGSEPLPKHIVALVTERALRDFDQEVALAGPQLADLEIQMQDIDERITKFITNCHGVLPLEAQSRSTHQTVSVNVCDSPKAAQISEGEPLHWHHTVGIVIRGRTE